MLSMPIQSRPLSGPVGNQDILRVISRVVARIVHRVGFRFAGNEHLVVVGPFRVPHERLGLVVREGQVASQHRQRPEPTDLPVAANLDVEEAGILLVGRAVGAGVVITPLVGRVGQTARIAPRDQVGGELLARSGVGRGAGVAVDGATDRQIPEPVSHTDRRDPDRLDSLVEVHAELLGEAIEQRHPRPVRPDRPDDQAVTDVDRVGQARRGIEGLLDRLGRVLVAAGEAVAEAGRRRLRSEPPDDVGADQVPH